MDSTDTPTFRPPRQPIVAPGDCELHQRDMTATFSTEMTLADAQRRLAVHQQWLPIDGDPAATLGQLIDGDSTGPLRLGYGAWRDLLLGAQLQNGNGELISAGGRTVKNVAGYDLTKFMVGQSGIFANLLTITTRTYRRPQGAIVATYPADAKLLGRLMPTPLRPQWALLAAYSQITLGYLGDSRTLDHDWAQLQDTHPTSIQRRSLEEDIADRAGQWRAHGMLACRVSIPPVSILEFATAARLSNWVGDPAFGIVLTPAASEEQVAPLREAAARFGGTVRVRRGSMLGPLLDVSTNPVERQIIERLKKSFDPSFVLAPLPWQ